MLTELSVVTAGLCLIVAVWCGIEAVRGVRPGWWTIGGLAAAEVGAVVVSVIGVVANVSSQAASWGLTVGYVLCAVLMLPGAFVWGISDASRWGNGVIVVGCLTTAVLVFRMWQLWG